MGLNKRGHMTKTRTNRVVTNEDILKYDPLIESFIRKSVIKNWKEASVNTGKDEISLGNSGYTISDIRQYLRCEVVIALKNFDEDKGTKPLSFIYTHLNNRLGALMKRLTRKSRGYGAWSNNIEQVLMELDRNE
jgi:hypothetical protein